MVASLGLAVALGAAHARRSVAVEVQAAVGAQARVARAVLAQESDPARLAAVFDGDRHVRAVVLDERGRVLARSTPLAAAAPAPGWVERALSPPLAGAAIDRGDVSIRLAPYPANEADEAWARGADYLLALVTFWLLCGGLTRVVLRRALRPVDGLVAALDRIGEGDFSARAPIGGPPELERLALGVARLSERLQRAEARAHGVSLQVACAQEDERAAIARDLHDELGPELFGVRIDAADLARRCAVEVEHRRRAEAILDATARMQGVVRDLLARLAPAPPSKSLTAGVEALLAVWRARLPRVALHLHASGAEPDDAAARDACLHVVREGLHNALRHGCATRIAVRLARDGESYAVTVEDDGRAGSYPTVGSGGRGLAGLRARLALHGGRLSAGHTAAGGWRLTADLPLHAVLEAAA